jgi:hypothetical protein
MTATRACFYCNACVSSLTSSAPQVTVTSTSSSQTGAPAAPVREHAHLRRILRMKGLGRMMRLTRCARHHSAPCVGTPRTCPRTLAGGSSPTLGIPSARECTAGRLLQKSRSAKSLTSVLTAVYLPRRVLLVLLVVSSLLTRCVLLVWRQGAQWARSNGALHLGPRAHGGLVHAHSAFL